MMKISSIALLISSFILLTMPASGQGSLEKVAVSLHEGWFV